jgi:hypothetical protein
VAFQSNVQILWTYGHLPELQKNSPQHHFLSAKTMRAVITLRELLMKFQTITFIKNSSAKLVQHRQAAITIHWIHQLFMMGVDKYWQSAWNLGMQAEDSLVMLAKTWDIPSQKVHLVFSFKLQQACEGKLLMLYNRRGFWHFSHPLWQMLRYILVG